MGQTGEQLKALRGALLDEGDLLEAVLKFKRDGAPWRMVRLRPVQLRAGRRLQISYLTQTQDITKNFEGREAARKVDELLALPFTSISVRTANADIKVTRTPQGNPVLSTTPTELPREPSALEHDRRKRLPLPPNTPDPFLEKLGVIDSAGRVKPSMHDKFAQINEFLKLLDHRLNEIPNDQSPEKGGTPLHIVDLGCGSATLTFAAYHYLNDIKGTPATVTGVDLKTGLVEKCCNQRDALGLDGLAFERSSILDYSPTPPPDIVLALHACDTASDEALAQAIKWQAPLILAAPCCHKDLNSQIQSEALRPILRHGILRQRLADIVTDAFRAQLLRIHGYQAEVIEFIGDEHTARNVLIRAVRTGKPPDKRVMQEYEELTRFWGVTPHLEKLLG